MAAERFFLLHHGSFYGKVCESDINSFKSCKNQEPQPNKGHFASTVLEAVMSDFHEPGWQHMLEEAPEKLDDIESGLSGAVTPGFAIRECYLPPFGDNNAAIGDGHPKDVRGKILERGLGIANCLAVNIPGDLPDLGGAMTGSIPFFSIAALNLALKILASALTGR